MFGLFKKKNQGTTQQFTIDGMHCTSCSMNIDGELEDTDGVFEANTQYAQSLTTVSFDPEKVSEKKIISVIKKLGYGAQVKKA